MLDEAVTTARVRGFPVAGWTIQSDPEGVIAALHLEGDDGSTPFLINPIPVCDTIETAAQACLGQAQQLPFNMVALA